MKSDDPMDWSAALKSYKAALELVAGAKKDPSKLLLLDRWYADGQVDIPGCKAMPYSTDFETFIKICEWKLTRGIFRPGLMQRAQSNRDQEVEEACKRAEAHLQVAAGCNPEDVHGAAVQAVNLLDRTLFGVGPATASAILARQFPWAVAFMSDEAMQASGLFSRATDIKYDIKAFANFNKLVQGKADSLNKKLGKCAWTGDAVARALWAHHHLGSQRVIKRPSTNSTGPSTKRSRT